MWIEQRTYNLGKCIWSKPFFSKLILRLANVEGNCIFGGDFNLVLDPLKDRSSKKILKSKAANILCQGMTDLGLYDVWRNLYPDQTDYSFYSNVHNVYSRIDFFLASKSLAHQVKDCIYLPASISDHNPIKLMWETKLILPYSKNWRFRTYMLKDPDFIQYMSTQIQIFLEANVNSASDSIIWEALKAFMRGQIISFGSYKSKEKRTVLAELEKEIRSLELEHSMTNNEEW